MLAQGKSAPEIQAILTARADLDLSGSPAHDASYLWSIALLVVSVLVLVVLFVRLRPRSPGGAATKGSPPPSDGSESILDARLDEELDEVS